MSKQLSKPPRELIEKGKQYLQSYQLEKALAVMNHSLLQSQLKEESELFLHSQLLWCKILLTKGRFSGDTSFSRLALCKLEEAQNLLPPKVVNTVPILFTLLHSQVHYQLGNVPQAQQLAEQLLLFSKTSQHVVGEIKAYNRLSQYALHYKDLSKAFAFAHKGQELLIQHTEIKERQVLAANYDLLSTIFLRQENCLQADNYGEKLLVLSSENESLQEYHIKAHLILGQSAIHQKEYAKAMTYLVKARAKSLAIQQQQLEALSNLQIGILYSEVSNYLKALSCFQNIEVLFAFILKDHNTSLVFYNAWGKAYFYSNQLEQAQYLFERVQQSANEHNDRQALVIALAYLGSIDAKQKDFKKALMFAKRTNNLIEQVGEDMDGLQINLINLGNIHYQLGKYSEAIKLTSRGITAAKRLKDELSEIQGYHVMSNIFQKQKDYKNALLYQTIYSKFFEDFFLRNDRQIISDIEQQFLIDHLRRQLGEQ